MGYCLMIIYQWLGLGYPEIANVFSQFPGILGRVRAGQKRAHTGGEEGATFSEGCLMLWD
jgi:hypothetical protein